ncbi:MAG: phospholipid carrier-dependent glycosyltransferase [Eubacteriales bacterium]|nr:phospholipid carrier-dependent glycosyltransferase [Eubacteriales bacterium]
MRCKRALAALLVGVVMFIAPAALAEDGALLHNGDFEQGSSDVPLESWYYDAWETEEGFTQAGWAYDEQRGGTVAYITNRENNDARWCQQVNVEPESYYRLSGYIMAVGADGDWGATLALDDTYAHTAALYDTAGWQYVELIGVTGAQQKSAVVQLRLGGYGATCKGSAYFDDVALEKLDTLPANVVAQPWQTMGNGAAQTTQDKAADHTATFFLLAALYACIFVLVVRRFGGRQQPLDRKTIGWQMALLLLGALLVRVILALAVYGYPNDVACWLGWSDQAVTSNLFGVYRDAEFLDYPPGYLYVLYVLGWINRLGLPQALQVLVVKLPAIAADFLTAWVIFRIARDKQRPREGLLLGALYLCNPLVLLDSAAWGQIDSILTLFIVLSLYEAYRGKSVRAATLYGLGLLLKPQMLLFAPILLFMLLVEMRRSGGAKKALVLAGKTLGAGALAFILPALPFWVVSGQPMWLFSLYFNTMGSYAYGSVNACNLPALLGGNWRADSQKILFLSYKVWGMLAIAASCLYVRYRYVLRDKNHKKLFFYAALLLCAIFTLGHQMHERYMFPTVALLSVYYLLEQDKRALYAACALTVMQFLNTAIVLAEQYITAPLLQWGDAFALASPLDGGGRLVLLSLGAVACLIGLIVMERKPYIPRMGDKDIVLKPATSRPAIRLPDEKTRWSKRDHVLVWALTLLYAVVALVYLGDLKVPTTMWKANASGSYVTVDLGRETALSQMWSYYGLTKGDMEVEISPDGDTWQPMLSLRYSESSVFQIWDVQNVTGTGRYVRITVTAPTVRLLEVAFQDADGNTVQPLGIAAQSGTGGEGQYLIDEQHLLPDNPSQLNSTYFDEIYHARTAWEHLNNIKPYETTHPPLGKLLIAVGIALFDMTPFGWRVVGTLFGILMVPLMYWFGMSIFKQTRYAFIAAFLFTFDFMHFAQTRIATIDTYGVFFIIAMFAFMYRYVAQTNYNTQPLGRTLAPLALCGVAFGLGAASKWICLYAGAGLAVIFFYSLFCRAREYQAACRGEVADKKLAETIRTSFWRNTVLTLLWCALFFIVIPAAIYVASYIPYARATNSQNLIKTMWDNQLSMYRYHSQLVDDHFFKSPWYQWPLLIKPIWFYKNSYLPAGWMGSIASFGNPAVWLAGTAAMVWMVVGIVRRRRMTMPDIFLLAAYLTQYLPWVLVPRSMFIYHYFASVPFFIMAIVLWIRQYEKDSPRRMKHIEIYLMVVLALFALFYPVLSGLPIPSAYGKLLRWLPTWYFTY